MAEVRLRVAPELLMFQAFDIAYEPGPLAGLLFENVDLSIDRGECVCLAGPNGVGKTALLEIVAGLRRPLRGHVVWESGATHAYVVQDVERTAEGRLADHLLAQPDDPAQRAQLKRHLARLGISPERLDEPASVFSIGERVRAEIAAALLSEPDALLLDEPTNHLDSAGRIQLVAFLKDWGGACLMVCHDRAVIDALADRTLWFESGKLTDYAGGYSAALQTRQHEQARAREAYEKSRQEQRRLKNAAEKTYQKASTMTKRPTNQDYSAFSTPFYAAKQAKLDKRARAIKKRVEQVAAKQVEKPFEPDAIVLHFASRPLRHENAVTVRGLHHSFGARELFGGLSLTLSRGQRVALLGPNGAGKTTLFRMLLGELEPRRGEIVWSSDVEVAYLTQGRERLDPELTIRQAIGGDEGTVRVLLGCMGLRYEATDKQVGVLSVGERTKAELVALVTSPANVLLLDEPTNHLDVRAREALEMALIEFPGAIVFTSHDQAFVERVATDRVILKSDAEPM